MRDRDVRVVPVEMDGRGMRPDRLEERGADIAYVMPSHQFPHRHCHAGPAQAGTAPVGRTAAGPFSSLKTTMTVSSATGANRFRPCRAWEEKSR